MSDEPDTLPTRAELARDLLLHVMRDYADEVCASWLVDQEFYLWEAACHGRFPHASDEAGARSAFCKRLGDLGMLAGGWWLVAGGCGRTLSGARGTRRSLCQRLSSIRSMWPGSADKKATEPMTAQGIASNDSPCGQSAAGYLRCAPVERTTAVMTTCESGEWRLLAVVDGIWE